MEMQVLRLDQVDQLSACRLSLMLGLNSDNDLIKRYLDFTTKLLKSGKALLSFHEEPYFWYSDTQSICAIPKLEGIDIAAFHHCDHINLNEHAFNSLSGLPGFINTAHKRILAINLQKTDQESIGFALFFDDEINAFDSNLIDLVKDYTAGFVRHIELKFNFEELNELYEQQAALNFSKTKFFSIISHDLRAPFHGLLGFSEVLAKERETLDDSSIQNIADYLYETSQSTYNLLESLLNWAMAEGGRFVYHPISFNLKQVTTIVKNILNTFALKKNIELIDHVADDIKIYADINMITSLIQNLVSNALKFTQTDGTGKVIIDAIKVADHIEITIRDTGMGMSESKIRDIFQPRITVSFRGTSGEKGAGLGLVLCKRFVDLNLGAISVTSKEGEGTVFTVTLPIAQNVAEIYAEKQVSEEKLV
ncbi:signal transduction histidine kinase [Acinetobacter baylyi]|uniref:histidine kinase n=1 Tax=Acinetobacter baylyi TaxID=202950 RepID=A0ABU0UYZ4_ACIBI|nr:HAMP domain-containing sensor histidine kinase [Acinetobacter baylyi]MDQ1209795.1 signal transduction histidine kinase [Acinetobacter baylyi]MDR6106606.1 signal transduction histidine kinase [Acinetobacter baylyi]MDR6186665.1 signal transduction histidine kinase [Acinetobacter baylyi]